MRERHVTLLLNQFAPLLANPLNHQLVPDSLKKLIRKARFQPSDAGEQRCLWQSLSDAPFTDNDLPDSQLYADNRTGLCVAPCYVHPDRDTLRLFHQDLAISDSESEQLVALIQPLVETFSGRLKIIDATLWFLALPQQPAVQFHALDNIHGQSVAECLPTGEHASDWIRLWNEIQMQLFDCDVNKQREQQGKLPINSVWFWGNSPLPTQWRHWNQVSGLPRMAFFQSADLLQQHVTAYSQLTTLPALHRGSLAVVTDWQDDLLLWEKNWFYPLLQALRHWQLRSLQLVVPQWGSYSLSPASLWQFWR